MAKALVVGMGTSGRASTLLLLNKGFEVCLWDDNPKALEEWKDQKDVSIAPSDALEKTLKSVDFILLSPGVHPNHPLYEKAKALGIPRLGEAEFALSFLNQRMIGITGTNGKTTVTLLLEHVLKENGIAVKAVGNVGLALSSYALSPHPEEVLIVELSSFQLETLKGRYWDAAAILNITPDHLDRYDSLEHYAKTKCDIQKSLKENAPFFVQEEVVELYGKYLKEHPFLTYGGKKGFYCIKEGRIYKQDEPMLRLPEMVQKMGMHDQENILIAYLLSKLSESAFFQALNSFEKPKHRIQWVANIRGVDFYDDSKGTNIDAVIRAVETMPSQVVLIAGGVDKGFPYTAWISAFKDKVRKIIALGKASEKMIEELQQSFNIEKASSMSEAVKKAAGSAKRGDCVLLSPGCASYDMFKHYAHRGEVFQECVLNLEQEKL